MNKVFILPAILVAGLVTTSAHATTLTGLADWCVNLNGDTSTACNGAGTGGNSGPAPGGINLAAFDTTPEPATNVLGQVVVNLAAGENNQFSAFYADYDLDYTAFGSFDDVAAVFGPSSPTATYELTDPNSGSLFNDFASVSSAATLGDTNNVGVANESGPPNQCCDVALAFELSGLNVAAGGTGTVTYNITTTAPASGFYIQQTNQSNGDSIYISAVVNIQNPQTGPTTPEPSTFMLGLGAIGMALFLGRARRVQN